MLIQKVKNNDWKIKGIGGILSFKKIITLLKKEDEFVIMIYPKYISIHIRVIKKNLEDY